MSSFRIVRFAAILAGVLLLGAGAALRAQPAAEPHEPAGHAVELNRLRPKTETPWIHHIYQGSLDLDPAASYVVSFSACASKVLPLDLFTKHDASPWAFFGVRRQIRLGTAWERHQLVFSAEKAIPGRSRLSFGFATADAAAIWIADIDLRKIENGRPTGPNLVRNPRFEEGLALWTVDGRGNGDDEFDVDVVPVPVLNRVRAR